MPIIVNDVEITDDEVHAEMQYHPASSLQKARYRAAQALVIRQLLVQAARENNLLDEDELADSLTAEKSIDRLLQGKVAVPEADEQSCRRYYEQNRDRFIDKQTREQLPFEMVRDRIKEYLHACSLQTGIRQYIKLLAGRARIAGFDLEESDSPLVQ